LLTDSTNANLQSKTSPVYVDLCYIDTDLSATGKLAKGIDIYDINMKCLEKDCWLDDTIVNFVLKYGSVHLIFLYATAMQQQ